MLYRPFLQSDYEACYALWSATEGIGLSDADSRSNIEGFLQHNPGLSFVAVDPGSGAMAGAVLCGCDGRRGYLHHLAVSPAYRRRGVGRELVRLCLAALSAIGVQKCHIFVIADNSGGRRFWEGVGWVQRTSLLIMSRDIPASP